MMTGPLGAIAATEVIWYAVKLITVMGPDFPDHPSPGTEGYKIFNRLMMLPLPLDAAYFGYELIKNCFSKTDITAPIDPPKREL